MDVVVTGSHGFIASHLMPALGSRGNRVIRLVRSRAEANRLPDCVYWDPARGEIDGPSLEGADAFIHLAGEGIGDRRWTDKQKLEILESRTKTTGLLAHTLTRLERPPAVMISASAIGYYGERGDETLTEASPAGTGFVAEVCRRWEDAAAPAREAGLRVVHTRSGIVLGKNGGALKRMLLPFRLGLGGRLGTGEQWFSWISIDDEVGAMLHLLEDEQASGPINLTSPNPVRNKDFTKSLGRALGRPTAIPVPTIALKAIFGAEAVDEGLLASQRVLPERLRASGYTFRLPEIDRALQSIVKKTEAKDASP